MSFTWWKIWGVALRYNAPFIDRGDTYTPASIAVRRWCPQNMGFVDTVAYPPALELGEGEIPLVVCHNSEHAVGFVTVLRSSKKELRYEALLDPELLPEDMERLMRAGVNPSSSVSVNHLELSPQAHSSKEAPCCTRALLNEISLVWTPAMSDTGVSFIGEVKRNLAIGPGVVKLQRTYPPGGAV